MLLKNTQMRACLIELGFIDNVEDCNILIQKQDDLALAIANGICKFLNIVLIFKEVMIIKS
ncbi:MAG: N-acetylmuramoyl-L-alanine amidase [Paraclostridium sp.]|uniref:N-acetylmuramoyl-L-alanine amidase n=1 Tax=Paraclostridium sp. TaxID=2023273 RepID=UPI003F2D49C9